MNNLFLFSVTGEAQIAYTNYQQPSMIPAHVMIFDNDTFGVLFMDLGSLALYSRVKENLSAIHFDDILQDEWLKNSEKLDLLNYADIPVNIAFIPLLCL